MFFDVFGFLQFARHYVLNASGLGDGFAHALKLLIRDAFSFLLVPLFWFLLLLLLLLLLFVKLVTIQVDLTTLVVYGTYRATAGI